MKKSVYAILATVAMLAGCTKETDVNNLDQPGKRLVTILADITQTKTTVTDAGIYSWTPNETIGVIEQDGSAVIPFSIQDAAEGLFSGTLTVGKDPVFAVSPAAFVSDVAESSGNIEYDITLDNIDNYVPGTTNAIMVAEYSGKDADNYRFHFKHVAALVKVRVENVPVGTAKVKLTLDKNITGIWADLDTTTPILGEDTNLGEPSLTLTLKNAVTNPNTSADYYFPVPCNTYTSFQFEMLNANGDRIKGMKKNGLTIALGAADLFLAPTVSLEPVTIVKGAEWTYTFTAKKFEANGTQTLIDANSVEMDWTLDGEYSSDGSWGYEAARGQQFGSGTKPYSSLTLTADSGVNGIEDVVINAAGAKDVEGTVSISVGNTAFVIKGSNPAETSPSLTNSATEYTFTTPDGELHVGDIVISYSQTSSKALYLKSISLNPDTRINPELAYSPAAYSVVASSSFETPTLSSVAGFNGTVTYAIGSGDDPDVASVNAETGAVTIGAKAGSVTVTATFAGDSTYKPGSASYTITVGAAALSVTEPAVAECTANSTTSFTVTSNVEWSATTDDGEIITSIDPSSAQSPSANPVTVTVTLAANAGAQRTATVKVRPTNQTAYSTLNQDVTVTQKLYTADLIYEKYSGVLTEGDYLFTNGTNALKAAVAGTTRLGSTTVAEYETGKIKNPDSDLVWHIEASGDYWTLYNASISKYAASNGSASGATLSENVNDYSKFSVSSTAQSTTYDFVNKYNTEHTINALFRWGGTYFACYASGSNPTTLYKLQDKREEAGMSWSAASATASYSTGNTLSFTALSLTSGNATGITYESTDETIATIDASTGAITITALSDNTVKEGSTIIKAIFAGDDNYKPQTVSYTLTVADGRDAATTPTFNPAAGEVEANQVVTFQPVNEGLTFHYTVDGSDPTISSASAASVTIDAAKTVKVIATKTGYKPSAIASAAYTIAGGGGTTTTHLDETGFVNTINASAHSYDASEASYTYDGATWLIRGNSSQGYKWIQTRSNTTPSYVGVTTSGNIKKVTITISNATNSKGGIGDITKHGVFSGTISLVTATSNGTTVGSTTTITNNIAEITPTGNNTTLYIMTSSAARIWDVVVEYEN